MSVTSVSSKHSSKRKRKNTFILGVPWLKIKEREWGLWKAPTATVRSIVSYRLAATSKGTYFLMLAVKAKTCQNLSGDLLPSANERANLHGTSFHSRRVKSFEGRLQALKVIRAVGEFQV